MFRRIDENPCEGAVHIVTSFNANDCERLGGKQGTLRPDAQARFAQQAYKDHQVTNQLTRWRLAGSRRDHGEWELRRYLGPRGAPRQSPGRYLPGA